MVAAGAFAPRDTGFLRTPLLSTWKSVWTKLPARGPTVRKSYSYSRWNGVLSAIFRWVFAGGAGPLWVVVRSSLRLPELFIIVLCCRLVCPITDSESSDPRFRLDWQIG